MQYLFNDLYRDRTVLVTGHTGFKGSWLAAWLLQLGAHVVGFSLPELPTEPSLFALAGLAERVIDVRGDVRDADALHAVIASHRPSIVLHLAAQPIVLHGVRDPRGTFDTNAGGTVNVLEAVRHSESVRAVVCVTTDKVYANQEWPFGYRENDKLGGRDPYSASKAMAELATASYRDTFFGDGRVGVATARAGNVIGGGDFADYRLVPDCLRALLAGEPIAVRNPASVRPWQHVLVPLSGYLWLAARLLEEPQRYSTAWNFGPPEQRGVTTGEIAERLINLWGSGHWFHSDPNLPKIEMGQLRLSWDKAAAELGWQPVYDWQDALAEIVAWTRAFVNGEAMAAVTDCHIMEYVERATAAGVVWTRPA